MDCSQDLLELDSDISRINIFKDSDPLYLCFLHQKYLRNLWKMDYTFLKEETWLFSLPPVVPTLSTYPEVKSPSDALNTTEIGLKPTPDVTVRERKSTALRKRTTHPILQS